MALALRLVAGALSGAVIGFLIGRARTCSAGACHAKANLVSSVVAGAFFGAAVA